MGKAQLFGGMALGAAGIVGLAVAGTALAIRRAKNAVHDDSNVWGMEDLALEKEILQEEPPVPKNPAKQVKPKPEKARAKKKTEKAPVEELDEEDFTILCDELEKCLDKKCEEMLNRTRDFGEAAIHSLIAYHDAMSQEFKKK